MVIDEGWIELEVGGWLELAKYSSTDQPFLLKEPAKKNFPAQFGFLHIISDSHAKISQVPLQDITEGSREVWIDPSPSKPRSWNEVPRNCKMEAE